jgi:5-methylcytosine-specific restriction endonuclease McrA
MKGDELGAYIARYHQPTIQEKRAEVFSMYGAFCACCGEDNYTMLTLDHVEAGTGERSRHSIKIVWNAGEPSERYQVLCVTCNHAKGAGPECPHRAEAKGAFSGRLYDAQQ